MQLFNTTKICSYQEELKMLIILVRRKILKQIDFDIKKLEIGLCLKEILSAD